VDVTMSRSPSMNIVTMIGLACNGVFAIEVLTRFNRAYRETTSKGGGRWVRNRPLIIKHYLKTWFIIDVIAACPLDMPFVLGILDMSQPGALVRFVALLRVVRCMKVLHVLPTVIDILTTKLSLTNSSAELFKFAIMLVLLVHYLACFWCFVGLNWEPSEDSSAVHEQPWIQAYGMEDYSMHRLYAVSMYVSIVAMFGGVSSVSPQNFVEYCALSSMMLVGGFTWAYVLSMLCAIFSKLDPRETEHKNMMDELVFFMEERDFDVDHKQRLRDFFTYTKDFARESGYSAIFERMSNKLRADTALIMGEQHVQLVWYLRKSTCEIGFLCEVALNLKPALYEIHEPLPIKKLTVISRGLVAQRMRLIGAGKVLGTDCLLKEHHQGLRDLDPVMCLSYVHVACISRDTLFSLAKDYPQADRTLKMAARHMTVRAALLLYYRKFVRHSRKLPGRVGMDEAASSAYDKRLGHGVSRRADSADLTKDVTHHGDGAAVERQLVELKKMVAKLAAAQLAAAPSTSPAPPRRMESMSRRGTMGQSQAKLVDVRARSQSRSGTKDVPARPRSHPRSRNGNRSDLEA